MSIGFHLLTGEDMLVRVFPTSQIKQRSTRTRPGPMTAGRELVRRFRSTTLVGSWTCEKLQNLEPEKGIPTDFSRMFLGGSC